MRCVTYVLLLLVYLFFFKQKTAYEMRISDWSSDVCSSDLRRAIQHQIAQCATSHRRYRAKNNGRFYAVAISQGFVGTENGKKAKPHGIKQKYREIGRASCRERVCQYV